jgi:hypothetical protein
MNHSPPEIARDQLLPIGSLQEQAPRQQLSAHGAVANTFR